MTLEALKRKRGAAKAKFGRKVKYFKTFVEKGSSIELLKRLYTDVEKSFEEVEAIHMNVTEESEEENVRDDDSYIDILESEKLEMYSMLEKFLTEDLKKRTVKLKSFDGVGRLRVGAADVQELSTLWRPTNSVMEEAEGEARRATVQRIVCSVMCLGKC